MMDAPLGAGTRYVARHADMPSSTGSSIYNTLYRELGLDAVYLQFSGKDPQEFVRSMKTLGFCGSTVVGSFATAILPYLDELDAHAARVGAVNTVTYHNGAAVGHKTDGPALIQALQGATNLRGKTIAIAGAGHLVREILPLLVQEGAAEVKIFNRTVDTARAVAESDGARIGGDLAALATASADIFINATPRGSKRCPDKDILPPEAVSNFGVVMDTAFIPSQTPLIEAADARRVAYVTGLQMFARQGAAQVQYYLGREIDLGRISELIDAEFNA